MKDRTSENGPFRTGDPVTWRELRNNMLSSTSQGCRAGSLYMDAFAPRLYAAGTAAIMALSQNSPINLRLAASSPSPAAR
ncbi:hypothetical protein, partial [Acinetobacter venetianus]|uniref:hypothetical protein n=1 Tax=Acinetobacter venetianus TaxID=52133 RepID=UPI003A92CC19